MWGYLEFRGGVQYSGGYHEYPGSYLEYRGDDASGGYHEHHGGIQYHGDTILCNLSTVGDIMSIVGVFSTKIVRVFRPTVQMDIPCVHHDILTVLSIPHSNSR